MIKLKIVSDADPVSINLSFWLILYKADVLKRDRKTKSLGAIIIKNNLVFTDNRRGLSKKLERWLTVKILERTKNVKRDRNNADCEKITSCDI